MPMTTIAAITIRTIAVVLMSVLLRSLWWGVPWHSDCRESANAMRRSLRRYPPRMAGSEQDGAAERLKAAADVLEEIVADRSLLRELPLEERTRLLAAAGDVHNPDVVQRRRFNKVVRREKKAARLGRDENVLAETGIRVHRAKPVFTTPNVFVPGEFEQIDVDEAEFREVVEPQHCYVCKERYQDVHPFYDQLCPACAAFNYRKRSETADLTGRVALLTGGRVKSC